LPEVPDVAGFFPIPPGIPEQEKLHQLGQFRPFLDLSQEMEVVRHEAVVGEFPGVFFLGLFQQTLEGLETLWDLEEEKAVISSGDQMIIAAIH
jgi:uncharacterized membrane protein